MFNNIKRIVTGAMLTTGLFCSSTLVSAQGYLRSFTLINHSSYTIRSLYVSSTDDRNWGYDTLGARVLVPGYQATVRLYPGAYDVKLVDQDGDSCVVNNVDFTRSDSLDLNDTLLLACEFLH